MCPLEFLAVASGSLRKGKRLAASAMLGSGFLSDLVIAANCLVEILIPQERTLDLPQLFADRCQIRELWRLLQYEALISVVDRQAKAAPNRIAKNTHRRGVEQPRRATLGTLGGQRENWIAYGQSAQGQALELERSDAHLLSVDSEDFSHRQDRSGNQWFDQRLRQVVEGGAGVDQEIEVGLAVQL